MQTSNPLAILVTAILAHQDAIERFDAAAAQSLGVNATDLRCLAIIDNHGPSLAGKIADRLGLSRGATTTAIDRLARAKLVARRSSEADGRSVLVQMTEDGLRKVRALWKPVRTLGRQHLESYSSSEIELLTSFFHRSIEVQAAALAKIGRQR